MKRYLNYKLIFILILICFVTIVSNTNQVYTYTSYLETTSKYDKPSAPQLKGKDEIIKIFKEIKRLRENIFSISINAQDSKETIIMSQKRISNFLLDLNNIKRNLEFYKQVYKDSPSDVMLADQMLFIVNSYELSLKQQVLLLKLLEDNDSTGSELFYSDYLVHIYYYLTLADQMTAYIDNYYTIK